MVLSDSLLVFAVIYAHCGVDEAQLASTRPADFETRRNPPVMKIRGLLFRDVDSDGKDHNRHSKKQQAKERSAGQTAAAAEAAEVAARTAVAAAGGGGGAGEEGVAAGGSARKKVCAAAQTSEAPA